MREICLLTFSHHQFVRELFCNTETRSITLVGWGLFFAFLFDLFFRRLQLSLRYFHERFRIIVAIFFRFPLHVIVIDERFAMFICRFPTSTFLGTSEFSGSASSSAKCMSSRTSAPSSGLTPARYCRVLITTFAMPDLSCSLQGIAQERIGFVPSFLRLEIIWLVEKHRIDLLPIDEVLDIYGLSGLQIYWLKFLCLSTTYFPFSYS